MWIVTPIGFFSIVQKPDDKDKNTLTVRARDRSDLEALRKRYLPSLGDIVANAGSDYAFRAKAPRFAVAEAMQSMCSDIRYDNFKNEVRQCQGRTREAIYHLTWEALRKIQERHILTR